MPFQAKQSYIKNQSSESKNTVIKMIDFYSPTIMKMTLKELFNPI